MTEIRIESIRDGGTQMRAEMNTETVLEYAQEMVSGTVFPPVVVYFDGTDHWLADGFHRREAAQKIRREVLEAEILQGTSRDAVLHGIGANANHGLRRTQEDKRRAIETILGDEEWSKWSDREIAKAAKVDHKTVGKVRRELLGGKIPRQRTVKFHDRHGNESQMRVKTTLVADLLKTISDADLISECQRRCLEVLDV